MLGFKNTYRLAVTKEAADKYNLKTFSDLAAVSDQLILVPTTISMRRKDGYPLLQSILVKFKIFMDMDISMRYNAGKRKLAFVHIHHGWPAFASDIVVLNNRGIYPSYLCGFVVRKDALRSHPELRPYLTR